MSAVSTINLNDFLVQKDSGDVVTGADWNKLVALFHAVNNNAEALLNTIKDVDTNAANIAQVTQGAVPDNSIGYDKLEKIGGIKNVYTFTEDITPKTGVTYYTLEDGVYRPHVNLVVFESGVQYYELQAVVTKPAIADADVVGDGVIHGYHCAELILGSLLNDSVTVYTDKGITGVFEARNNVDISKEPAPVLEHTITFEKQHKAFIILGYNTISLLYADPNKPDVHIGAQGTMSGPSGLGVTTRIGETKYTGYLQYAALDRSQVEYPTTLYGVLYSSTASPILQHCYYDYSTRSIKITVRQRQAGYYDATHKNYAAAEYAFGDLIIGL